MLINKHKYSIRNDKKLLHKVGKQWVTISVAMLALIGAGVVTTETTHAASTPSNNQSKTEIVKNNLNKQLASSSASNNAKPANVATKPSSQSSNAGINAKSTESMAQNMHTTLVNNAQKSTSNSVVPKAKSAASTSASTSNAPHINSAYANYLKKMGGNSAYDNLINQEAKGQNNNIHNPNVDSKVISKLDDTRHVKQVIPSDDHWICTGRYYNNKFGDYNKIYYNSDCLSDNEVHDWKTGTTPYEGMTYRYSPSTKSVEFTGGTANSDLTHIMPVSFASDSPWGMASSDNTLNIKFDSDVDASHVKNTQGMINFGLGGNYIEDLVLPKNLNTNNISNMNNMFPEVNNFTTGPIQNIIIKTPMRFNNLAELSDKMYRKNDNDNFTSSNLINLEDGEPHEGVFSLSPNIKGAAKASESNWIYCPQNGTYLSDNQVSDWQNSSSDYDGLSYRYSLSTGALEFTSGKANSDLYRMIYKVGLKQGYTSDEGYRFARDFTSIKYDSDIDFTNVKDASNLFFQDGSDGFSDYTNVQNNYYLHSIALPKSFNKNQITNMSGMFAGNHELQDIILPDNFNTSQVTNMSGMFAGDSSMKDYSFLNSFDTSKVTDMSNMFTSAIENANFVVPNFNTSHVTNMGEMFSSDTFNNLVFPSTFDTRNVSNMAEMFAMSEPIKNVTFSKHFDTKRFINNPKYVTQLFFDPNEPSESITIQSSDTIFPKLSLDELIEGVPKYYRKDSDDNYTTAIPVNLKDGVFNGTGTWVTKPNPRNLVYSDIYKNFDKISKEPSTFDIETYPNKWLYVNANGKISFTPITNSNGHVMVAPAYRGLIYKYSKNTNSVEFTGGTASYLNDFITNAPSDIKNAKAIKFDDDVDISSVNSMNNMFSNDYNLQSLDFGSDFNTYEVSDMDNMFNSDYSLKTLTLPNSFNTSKVTNMYHMFHSDHSLQSLTLGNMCDTSRVLSNGYNISDMYDMFGGDKNLNTITINSHKTKTPNVPLWNMYYTQKPSNTSIKSFYKQSSWPDANGKYYTSSKPNDFSKGAIGTFVVSEDPIKLSYADIYNNSDGFEEPQPSDYVGDAPNNWSFVKANGQINDLPIKDHNGKVMIAPYYNGLTYKYNKNDNSIEFISGTPNSDLSNFITNAPASIKNASSISFGNINTSNVIGMQNMFANDSALKSLDLGSHFNINNVTNMQYMFADDPELKTLKLSGTSSLYLKPSDYNQYDNNAKYLNNEMPSKYQNIVRDDNGNLTKIDTVILSGKARFADPDESLFTGTIMYMGVIQNLRDKLANELESSLKAYSDQNPGSSLVPQAKELMNIDLNTLISKLRNGSDYVIPSNSNIYASNYGGIRMYISAPWVLQSSDVSENGPIKVDSTLRHFITSTTNIRPYDPWYQKDPNNNYTSAVPVNLYDGNTHPGTWVRTPNPKPLQYSDIYNSTDGETVPAPNPWNKNTSKFSNPIKPANWDFVDASGHVSSTPITNGQDHVMIAPVYRGMTYKYDKNTKSVEFVSGSPADPKYPNTPTSMKDFLQQSPSYIQNANSIRIDSDISFSDVHNMSHMFSYGKESSLTLPSNFDTSHVTDMHRMFAANQNLNSLILPKTFDTSNVNDVHGSNMNGIFYDTPLNSLEIQSSNTKLHNDADLPSMYKQLSNKNVNGYETSDTPNDFSQGNVGIFVATENPVTTHNTAIEHILYHYHKTPNDTYRVSTYDMVVPLGKEVTINSNNANSLKPGWHIANPVTFTYTKGNNYQTVPVLPDQANVTIQYEYNDNVIASYSGYSGDDYRTASGTGNKASVVINAQNHDGLPDNYRLAKASVEVPYNGDTYDVQVVPATPSDHHSNNHNSNTPSQPQVINHYIDVPTYEGQTSAPIIKKVEVPVYVNGANSRGGRSPRSVVVHRPFVKHVTNLLKLVVGQSGNYHGYEVTRIKAPAHFRWFYIIKNCLAHTNMDSVGTNKHYVKVLRPSQHYTFHILRTFRIRKTVRHHHITMYCYEVRAKFGKHFRNYFITHNVHFVQNAYVQPHDLRHVHGAFHHYYYRVRVTGRTSEYKSRYYTHKTWLHFLRRGTILHVKRVITIGRKGDFMTRLLLTNGHYVTANRNYVKVIK